MHFTNFNEILAYNAKARPSHKVVTFEGDTWTYGQLDENARAIAVLLHHAGIRKGDRVGILLPNQTMFLGALFGTTLLGAIPILINVFYGSEEILGIIRHSQAKVLLMQMGLLEELERAREIDSLPYLEEIWTVGAGDSVSTYPSLEQALTRDVPPLPYPTAEISGDDIALMIYTSGTTGSSKGVMLTYRSLIENARVTGELMQYTDRDVLLPALPLFSSAGVSLTLISVLTGTHMVLIERNNPQIILESIERERVTILDMVPSGLKLLMKFNRSAGHDVSSLRLVVVGGDSSPPDIGHAVIEELRCNFAVVYGLTEMSPVVSITRLDDSEDQKIATVGPVIEGVEISVRDDARRAVQLGTVGEICCRGLYVTPGYFRNPEETRQCIDDEGWFYTGDLGYVHADGRVVIVGRKKDMIIIGGHNVFPSEVESHLIKHPDIKDVAVVGIEHGAIGNYLIAFVLPKSPCLSGSDVQAYCKGLAQFKVPQRVILAKSFPYTGSGKVNKRELRRMFLEAQ